MKTEHTRDHPKQWTGPGLARIMLERTDLDPDAMLTMAEIAQRWHMGRATILRRIESGELPAGNFGVPGRARYRVRLADLLAYELNAGLPSSASLPALTPDDVS